MHYPAIAHPSWERAWRAPTGGATPNQVRVHPSSELPTLLCITNFLLHQIGTGSDARRKRIISSTLSNDSFFENIIKTLQKRFKELATEFQTGIQAAIETHLAAISQTMDIVRDENVIAESERDGDFRRRVEGEVGWVRGELGRMER